MRIPVRLGGHTHTWRFPDSGRLADWIDARPWTERSTVEVIRVSDARTADAVYNAVRRGAVGADCGAAGLQCHDVDPAKVAARGFAAALADCLGVAPAADRYTLHQRLAGEPALCLVGPLGDDCQNAVPEAVESADLIGKLNLSARICVFFADTQAKPLTGPAFDLTAGAPAFGPDWLSLPREQRWGAYLHVRLAWEAAGDPARALDMAADILPRLAKSDDDALERSLNTYADAAFAKLASDDIALLAAGATKSKALEASRDSAAIQSLTDAGLYWAPRELDEALPAPWVARALLRRGPAPAAREHLRGAVVCAPLAKDVFTVCIQLETRDRGRLIDPAKPCDIEQARHQWTGFQDARTLCYNMHPAECPAVPDGPWAFASLGEIHEKFKAYGHIFKDRAALRELRNHVAHCHYVGWATVEALANVRWAYKPS